MAPIFRSKPPHLIQPQSATVHNSITIILALIETDATKKKYDTIKYETFRGARATYIRVVVVSAPLLVTSASSQGVRGLGKA